MAIAELVARLEDDAAREAASIAANADAEVEAARAATDAEIREVVARRVGAARTARQQARDRELARARREARTRELEAAHALVARVLARAHALVPEVAATPAYRAAVPGHLEDALSYVEGRRPRVICPATLAAVLGPIVLRHADASLVVDAAAAPGVVVEAGDGSVVVDNTLAARLDRLAPSLAVDIVAEVTRGRR